MLSEAKDDQLPTALSKTVELLAWTSGHRKTPVSREGDEAGRSTETCTGLRLRRKGLPIVGCGILGKLFNCSDPQCIHMKKLKQ